MISAGFYPSPLTVRANCSFFTYTLFIEQNTTGRSQYSSERINTSVVTADHPTSVRPLVTDSPPRSLAVRCVT